MLVHFVTLLLGVFLFCLHSAVIHRAPVKLYELGVHMPGGLFAGLRMPGY